MAEPQYSTEVKRMPVVEMNAREIYGKALVEVGRINKDIVVLTADLMRSTSTGDFKKANPERFFNFGIAEQNMFTAAAGMALCGKMPFVSTFAAFNSMRACEQVRTDIAYPNLPVRMVATHSGFALGGGTTHNALEDIAIMRCMANMTVINPGDPAQVGKAVHATLDYPGPVYIRIGRGNEPVVYHEDYEYKIGKAITAKTGNDASIIAVGITLSYAVEAAYKLAEEGINVRVIDMHTIKPLDTDAVLKAAAETGVVITVEEHNVIGGLGSAVSETILEAGIPVKFKRLGVPDLYAVLGKQKELHAKYGFDADGIYAQLKSMLQ
jgi:transketolase